MLILTRFSKLAIGAALASVILCGGAQAQSSDTTLEALLDSKEIPVTIDNFVRAATDIEFGKYTALGGGVNQFFHFRAPTSVDHQPTIRMNRDTLYSSAIIDISEGATVTLPEVGDRYMTGMVVNQDHYINDVLVGGGTFTLDMETFGTPYVGLFIRVLVDADDPEDVAAVNALQDQMKIEAPSAKPFIVPDYDQKQFEALVSAALGLGPFVPESALMFGPKDKVNTMRHFIGTAGGWGGLPETEALYVGVDPGLPVAEYVIEVPAEVPVGAFWSISLYNAKGFFEPNEHNGYVVNSVMGTRNDDGSMTVHLGGCEDGRVNCLPIMEGWNYTVRLYRPGPELLDGSWTFPEATRLN